jgi:hypothetical protein
MKLVLTVFLCLFSGLNAFPQSDENNANRAVGVVEISLARGDGGNDEAVRATDKFRGADVPILCFIELDAEKPATVKMILVAVKAFGLKPETKIIMVSYTTKENENQVNFTASPSGAVWTAGDYRVDVYINGQFVKSRTFIIEKSSQEIEQQKPPAAKPRTKRKLQQSAN